MDIVVIEKGQYSVAAIGENVSGKTESAVMEYMMSEKAGKCPLADALRPIFQLYAEKGRDGVTANMFHEANKKDGIWQFRKGDYRIFCFKDPEKKKLILLTHGVRKTTRKAKKSEVDRAIRMRDVYLECKRTGQLRTRTISEVEKEYSDG